MPIVNSFLARFFKWKIISPDCPEGKVGRPLMTRYAVWRSRRKVTFNKQESSKYALFLHHFHRSDLDDFHDHPWAFATFLFHSGYWEHMPAKQWLDILGTKNCRNKVEIIDDNNPPIKFHVRVWHRRFSILYRPATFQHYIEFVKPTWTLVFRFPEVREWGFTIRGVWTPWRKAEELKSRSICEDI